MHRLGFWDALIVQAAKQGACSVLYTEDLPHGRSIDGVKVVDPFR
jgi:predicted nucleic acid-binding protein